MCSYHPQHDLTMMQHMDTMDLPNHSRHTNKIKICWTGLKKEHVFGGIKELKKIRNQANE